MNDNRLSACPAGAIPLTALIAGEDGAPTRRAQPGRGRKLLIEALSLIYAREERSFATQRLRALADFDTQVLTLALAQCQELLGNNPDDPHFSGALGLLTRAMQGMEGAA